MMKFSRILWKKGRNQSPSKDEIELTDMQLAAVQGAVGGRTGGGSGYHGGYGHHHGGYGHHGYGWYGGGYPSYYPSYPYGYGYGYQPAPQVILVQAAPAVQQPPVIAVQQLPVV